MNANKRQKKHTIKRVAFQVNRIVRDAEARVRIDREKTKQQQPESTLKRRTNAVECA